MKKVIILFICFIINLYSQPLPEPVLKQNFPIKLCEDCSVPGIYTAQFYDLDNDGNIEIIIATGYCVYIIKYDGEHLSGWPKCYSGEYIPSGTGPAIGDVDGDGSKDIAFITLLIKNNIVLSTLHIINKYGNELSGYPINFLTGFTGGPVLYDIDQNGKLEIFLKASDGIYGYDYQGRLLNGWPQYSTIGNLVSAPRISDIDFDGEAEIFSASALRPHIDSLKRFAVYSWNTKGELKPGWPFIRDHRYFDNIYLGAIAKFHEDSIGAIIFASTRYPPIDTYEVYALNGRAELLPGWPRRLIFAYYWLSGVILFDYYRANLPEVVVMGDLAGYFYAWDMSGELLPKFPMRIGQIYPGGWGGDVTTVPILYHDIENREFVMFTGTSLTVSDTGFMIAMRSDSTHMPWSPLKVYGQTWNSPGFSDLENDGNVEMVFITKVGSTQYLYVYEFRNIPFDKRRFPWPVTSANRWNTGEFGFEPTDTIVVAVRDDKSQPFETKLYQNYPNPFNTSTRIRYELDRNTSVKLSIYNVLGQLITTIVDAYQKQGRYEAVWDARKYPSGVYYVKLETDTNILMSKVLYVK